MSVDLTKGATVELVKRLSDDLRTRDDNTKYSSAGAAMRDKANVNGYYEDLVSGGTDQIISSVFEEDSEPYLFRTSGGSIDIGDREEDTIVGGTVAWNQLINGYSQTGNVSVDFADGVYTLTGGSPERAYFSFTRLTGGTITGHKYLGLSTVISNPNNLVFDITSLGGSAVNPSFNLTPTARNRVFNCSKTIADNISIGIFGADAGIDYTGVKLRVEYFDLTQMFGTTIADYIYSLEQANAGAGVAWFKKLFPNMDAEYSWTDAQEVIHTAKLRDYQSGILLSVEGLQSHDMTGFNQCSDFKNGNYTAQYNAALSAKVKLLPNTTYAITFKGVNGHSIYRNEYVFTPYWSTTCTGEWQTVVLTTVDENTLKEQIDSEGYLVIFKNGYNNSVAPNFSDVCINLHWDGERDGEYEPYKKHSYPLDDSLTLRGIPKLDSANKLYYDGDIYEADGTVTRKYGIVDLGSLTWTLSNADTYLYYSTMTVKPYGGDLLPDMILSSGLYEKTWINRMWNPNYNTNAYSISGGGKIAFQSESFTSAEDVKTKLSGVYAVYPLATPTTEQAEPYQTPQIVDDFGTEEYVTDSIVPVGHVTKYMPNLKAKLEMAPDSPSDNGDYIVRHTNGLNEYVPLVIPTELPTTPSEDGTYHLKVTVANGTATLSWESES